MRNSRTSRFWLLTTFLALIAVSCQDHEGAAGVTTSSPTSEQKEATVKYWNALCDIDERLNHRLKDLSTSIQSDVQNGATQIAVLSKFADRCSQEASTYNQSVTDLPVINVDDRLIDETAQELKEGLEIAKHLTAMSEAANSYSQWSEQKDNPLNQQVFSDLFDSFVKGLEGRPFAGYEKFKSDQAKLDAEGQQIIAVYLQHEQALNALFEQTRTDDVKEMELRAYLAKKYGVEFKPRPHLDS